jgi:hypothetical protein
LNCDSGKFEETELGGQQIQSADGGVRNFDWLLSDRPDKDAENGEANR